MRAIAKKLCDTPYILKGGAALILTYQLNRFSSDLDFDSARKLNLTGKIENALQGFTEIELLSFKLVKDTDTVQRYKMHYLNLATNSNVLLKVETSFRDPPSDEVIDSVADIKTYRIEYLFDQKLLAAQRRTQARDLYDLAFLVQKFGDQLRADQIQEIAVFANNPNELLNRYAECFTLDLILNRFSSLEDIILSLQLGIENLALSPTSNLDIPQLRQKIDLVHQNIPLDVILTSTPPSDSVQASIDLLHQSLNDFEKAALRLSNALDRESARNIDLPADSPAASPKQNATSDFKRQDKVNLTTDADSTAQANEEKMPDTKKKPQLEL